MSKESIEPVDYFRPTDLLLSMLGTIISEGIEPHYMATSGNILMAAGWNKIAQMSDQGKMYMLGMNVQLVKKDVLCIGASPISDEDINDSLTFQLVKINGEVMATTK